MKVCNKSAHQIQKMYGYIFKKDGDEWMQKLNSSYGHLKSMLGE